ncbi:hypothetical protein GXW74_15595 [Roseomonas eburnea]|uniref:DUF2190 family protein n=1 Tax=Neoroseomonas eburnea TaxID=1346889 RepID=A0A9X9XDY2_9PROT|nr:hypothetical protein [Neoroseomonas eburnea]MBR0681918.1 hypothetical protein [Neoroseomonas eburnea]
MALAADRNTPERGAKDFAFAPAAGQQIFRGALVALDASGELVKGAVATTLKALGRADNSTEDAGYDGVIRGRRGCFRWKNSAAGDAITNADYGATVYIVDDETVAKTNGTNTRSAAGICRGVDAQGVWVET